MQLLVLLAFPLPIFAVLSPFIILSIRLSTYRKRIRHHRTLSRGHLLHAGVISCSPALQSPRARNHTKSLASSGRYTACLHAYPPCVPFEDSLISFLPIGTTNERTRSSLIRTVVYQTQLMYASLVSNPSVALQKYDVIILNTPPCIPSFAVALFAARVIHSCPLVVDWHNFAYSIMETTGRSRLVIALARFIEWFLGRQMDGNICVSQAMATFLAEEWAIDAHVVYDRPHDNFQRLADVKKQDALFRSLHECAGVALAPGGDTIRTETVASENGMSNHIRLRPQRPAVVVSSTSWTPDEDFSILLDALVDLDVKLGTALSTGAEVPFGGKLVCAITGKGPLREAFEAKCAASGMKNIEVWFAYLPHTDYPRLLGSADVGISMHTSSSGLDLPMKVVDMLGSGLPVLSFRFQCIEELLRPGETGFLFSRGNELADRLFGMLFTGDGAEVVKGMSEFITETFKRPGMRWQGTWEQGVLPVLQRLHDSVKYVRND